MSHAEKNACPLTDCILAIRMAQAVTSDTGEPGILPFVSWINSPQAAELLKDESVFRQSTQTSGLEGLFFDSVPADAGELKKYISSKPCDVVGISKLGVFVVAPDGAELDHKRAALLSRNSRKPSSRKAEVAGRLKGCVALVTGSAQGFGRGIAEELLQNGACVTVADIKDDVGEALVRELNAREGAGRAVYCHCDVVDSASLSRCVEATALAFGGVDMFISNAGVLKAGSLEEMDESGFDLVTKVNYKAYFLGVKAVAPVMKRQHVLHPAGHADIIQINSKSGLEGSDKNFAYAGSKFGGIGLTQSFAKELLPYGIKVNAICPGNYFDGPLWADPEKGLFVQYLRAGKVPGAKTIEDVKQSYLSRIPMKRGCTPKDVARAIFYLREQEYETGQAIPVTGGQVMLS